MWIDCSIDHHKKIHWVVPSGCLARDQVTIFFSNDMRDPWILKNKELQQCFHEALQIALENAGGRAIDKCHIFWNRPFLVSVCQQGESIQVECMWFGPGIGPLLLFRPECYWACRCWSLGWESWAYWPKKRVWRMQRTVTALTSHSWRPPQYY